MVKVRRFEDLQCWQKARQLANAVYDLTCHSKFARDFKLRNQIQGAVGSIMHNIAEGCDSGTDPEFVRFLRMARRSCSEGLTSGLNILLFKNILERTLFGFRNVRVRYNLNFILPLIVAILLKKKDLLLMI